MTDAEPVTTEFSSREMRGFFRSIYRDAGFSTRELNAWRHKICPYEPVMRWIPPGAQVLDFGCGAGAVLMLLSERHQIAAGTGCDVSTDAIATAKAAQRRLSHDVLDFRRIADFTEIPDEKFQVVIMVDVLHHIPPGRQQEAIGAATRRVATGGRLIYKDMTQYPFWRRWGNTAHDLVVARQLVNYITPEKVVRWALDDNMTLLHAEDYSRYFYGHQLRVFLR